MAYTLEYYSGGNWYSSSVAVLSIRGFTEPDEIQQVRVVHDLLNGNKTEQCIGFQKVIEIRFAATLTPLQRRYLADFILAERKQIYDSDTTLVSELVPEDEALVSEWLESVEHGRKFTARFIDPVVRHVWETGGPLADELMYCKLKVQITGTQASPETLTTNSGKLTTMETGEAWPTLNDTTHVHHVSVNGAPYQERIVNLIKDSISIVSGNLTCQVALADMGKDASDGNDYIDFVLYLQEKP